MAEFANGTWFTVEHCCSCGMQWAMTNDFRNRRLKDRAFFYCPAGHRQHYTGESPESKLKRELERERQMREAADARALKEAQEREQIAKAHRKMRQRVMNGVCPCCNRTFQNLLRHMKTEHPEFNERLGLQALRSAFGMAQSAVAKEAGILTAYVSNYERGRHVPEYAKERLDQWVERHQPTDAG